MVEQNLRLPPWFGAPPRLSMRLAIELVDTPFKILVENGRFDRAFLLAMCSDEHRAFLEGLEAQRRLAFHGAGGIDELRESVNDQFIKDQVRHLKYWAIFDSDPKEGRVGNLAPLRRDRTRPARSFGRRGSKAQSDHGRDLG